MRSINSTYVDEFHLFSVGIVVPDVRQWYMVIFVVIFGGSSASLMRIQFIPMNNRSLYNIHTHTPFCDGFLFVCLSEVIMIIMIIINNILGSNN